MTLKELDAFFTSAAAEREKWLRRNWYYNQQLSDLIKFHVLQGSSVLEIGDGTGDILSALSPADGLGITFSDTMADISSRKHPDLKFVKADTAAFETDKKFDYVIIPNTIGYLEDIQASLKNIHRCCTDSSRIVITYYNYLWEPLLKTLELLGLKMKQPPMNWLSAKDIQSLLYLEGFDVVKTGEKILLPLYIPLLSGLMNKYLSNLPLIRWLCLTEYLIARPLNTAPARERSVSIVVPARNEKGNIDKVAELLPTLGTDTEIIFIEGHSTDGTWEEILRVADSRKDRKIKYARQAGEGKADAVRKGFELASGEILVIYDADMTVPAADLLKFYDAIVRNKGEFIHGSRLVYPMQKEAMRVINLFGNKLFSLIFSWLLNQRTKDTLCGTKVLSRDNYDAIAGNRAYFGDFDPFGDFDLLLGASKLDLKIIEIPIRYQDRTYGETNIRRFAHGWLLIRMCFFAMKKIKFT